MRSPPGTGRWRLSRSVPIGGAGREHREDRGAAGGERRRPARHPRLTLTERVTRDTALGLGAAHRGPAGAVAGRGPGPPTARPRHLTGVAAGSWRRLARAAAGPRHQGPRPRTRREAPGLPRTLTHQHWPRQGRASLPDAALRE